jgi:hypothetical protein
LTDVNGPINQLLFLGGDRAGTGGRCGQWDVGKGGDKGRGPQRLNWCKGEVRLDEEER